METAYVPDPTRYDHATFRRCGSSGLVLPAISLGLWQNFGGADVFETGRAMIRRAFDRGVTHFDLANNYGPPYGSAEENFGDDSAQGFPRPAQRARHFDQGRLGHVARPLRHRRLAQISARLARRQPQAHGPRLRRHLLRAPPLERLPARRNHGRAGLRRASGQGALRRHLVLQPRAHARRRQNPQEHGRAAAHSPAVLLHAESLDRERPARHARGTRRRLHRLFAARAGPAHRQVSQGRSEGFARQARKLLAAQGISERRKSQARPRAQRHCASAAARRWRRWPSPGCCATNASPQR